MRLFFLVCTQVFLVVSSCSSSRRAKVAFTVYIHTCCGHTMAQHVHIHIIPPVVIPRVASLISGCTKEMKRTR